ncbi:IS21-like element helper ATPase IstB [Bacillus sp. sid0103]|uniref:IS21-like element helper ATPase IstB n=1 Tax=Bacillus sp. sid0103 TaxID=2856337 RepID=UPI001C469109|nr:IS21-like element helper ATPase IstB [Bacillus sp. sid0103]MBV7509802.1 IS21-like element helper ATPase IstB [Bacillus sp. sid0103]
MITQHLTERLIKVGWHHTSDQIEGLLEDASKDNVPYSEFLNTILLNEIEFRESAALEKRVLKAKLPFKKTVHEFDFDFQPSLSEKRIKEVLTCRFIENGDNVILLGPPGVGKTHLSVAFSTEAIIKGYTALFIRADDFINECEKAEKQGLVNRIIKRWSKPDILVIDELGYFPFDNFSANIFFQVISKRYEKGGSLIITSNKSFIEWGKIFGDEVLATAILDRLLHHATTFNIKGDSYRLREKQKAGIQPAVLER